MCSKGQLVHINSTYRDNGTFDNFNISLQKPVSYSKVTLLDCTIPNSQWLINSTNNNLKFTEASTILNAIIPIGSYTISQFVTVLATSINSASTHTYSVTYSTTTGQLTITSTVNFTLLLGTYPTSLAYIMGFAQNNYSSTSLSLTSPNPVNLSPPLYLHVSFPNIGIPNCIIAGKQPFGGTFPIPQTGNSFSISNYSEECCYRLHSTISNLSQIQVLVRNSDGTPAGINVDWCITLLFSP